jgi:hypothetical protein
MTFATATIQGYVNWIGVAPNKTERSLVVILMSVPGRKGEEPTSYKVSTWDKQATLAAQYIRKGQIISVSGKLALEKYQSHKQEFPFIRIDFATILDYGTPIEGADLPVNLVKSNINSEEINGKTSKSKVLAIK